MSQQKLTVSDIDGHIDDFINYYGPAWVFDASAASGKSFRDIYCLLGLEREFLNLESAALNYYGITQDDEGDWYVHR